MLNRVAAANKFLGGEVEPPTGPLFTGGFAGFSSIILRIIFILAGLYAFWNFIVAGYMFLSAGGDPEAVGKAWETIWKSLIGLLIVVVSFVFAALIGWLLLGSPTAILAPKLVTN